MCGNGHLKPTAPTAVGIVVATMTTAATAIQRVTVATAILAAVAVAYGVRAYFYLK